MTATRRLILYGCLLVCLVVPSIALGQVAKIAFHTYRNDPNNAEVYTMLVNGSEQTNLSNNPANDEYPVICGSKVVYASDRDSTGYFDIWVQNLDGSGTPTNLTPHTPYSNEKDPHRGTTTLSQNQVVFISDRDGNNEVYRVNLGGGGLIRLTDNDYSDENPQWCGDQIIFVRDLLGDEPCGTVLPPACKTGPSCPANPGTDYQLFIMSADGDGDGQPGSPPPARALTCGILHNDDPDGPEGCVHSQLDTMLFYWPSWHVNDQGGQDIVFSAYRPGNYEGRKIYRMTLCEEGCCADRQDDLGEPLTDTLPSVQNDYPAWSPAGDFITFASNRENGGSTDWEVYTADAVFGTLVTARTADPADDEDPHWAETKP